MLMSQPAVHVSVHTNSVSSPLLGCCKIPGHISPHLCGLSTDVFLSCSRQTFNKNGAGRQHTFHSTAQFSAALSMSGILQGSKFVVAMVANATMSSHLLSG